MKSRHRALFATSAILYAGPLYAGMAGFGFETMPLFGAFFMVWLALARPGDWPTTAAGWRTPRAIAWPMLLFTVQMVVAGFCLVIGSGIGGVLAVDLPLPLAVVLGISFMAIFLAWTIRRKISGPIVRVPGEELGIGSGILDVGIPQMPGMTNEQAFVETISTYLSDLGPAAAQRARMDAALDAIEKNEMGPVVFSALQDAEDPRLPFIQAEALLALRPSVVQEFADTGRLSQALDRALMTRNGTIADQLALAALDVLPTLPEIAKALPPPARLRAAADEMPTAVASSGQRALRSLANALEQQASLVTGAA